jgi:acyl-coenzyme A synthetase/AMP-(fatty) acid ligase
MTYLDKNIRCLFVPVENTVESVEILTGLLKSGVNFFVRSASSLVDVPVPVFCDKVLIGHELIDNPGYRVLEGQPAADSGLVIFSSSGTTGRPKFICFRGDKLLSNAAACAERFGLSAGSKVLIPVPIAHMYGLGAGLLPALQAGAEIEVMGNTNVIRLMDRLSGSGPDVTLLTPALCRMLLQVNRSFHSGLYVSAGERINTYNYSWYEKSFGRLINLYGCTEMGAMATTPVEGDAMQQGLVRPLPGVFFRIDGGELLCRHGAGFECYLDADGIPYSGYTEDGWYATKDLGVLAGEDCLLVTGRTDHCINRLGFLVSLQEIESRIEALLAGIEQAVVLAYDAEVIAGSTLIAVCELRDGNAIHAGSARTLCRQALPAHMAPDKLYFVESLPRLGNGKPDRQSLQKLYAGVPG